MQFSDKEISCEYLRKQRKEAYKKFDMVDHINKPITYCEFFDEFLVKNKLCVIGTSKC